MSDPANTRRLVGFALIAGALVMGIVAALFDTGAIAGGGASRSTIVLILGVIAAVDAVIGMVLIVKS
jgi:hypothetical protein